MSTVPEAPKAIAKVRGFTPPSLANFNAMYPGFAHRFIDTTSGNRRGDRLQYWLSQGWEVAKYGNEGMGKNRPTGASSQDGAVHYRSLVLIRIPMEAAQARNDHYREKHNRMLQASNAMRELAQAAKDARAKDRGSKTSAFSDMEIRKGAQLMERTTSDTSKTSERIVRDVDQDAVRDLRERMDRQEQENKALRAETDRLKAEVQERRKKPSERARKSFPTS